jgi:hypothetical protein
MEYVMVLVPEYKPVTLASPWNRPKSGKTKWIFRKSAVGLSRVTEYVSVKGQLQLPKVPELSDPDSPAVNVDGNGS